MRFAALILAGLALAGCGAPSAPAGGKPAAAAPDIQWGEAVNGLQAGLAVKRSALGPEPKSALVFAVRNTGTQPIKIMKVEMFGGCGYYAPMVEVTSDGKVCRWQGPQVEPIPLSAGLFIGLAPGAADSVERLFDPQNWGLKPPFKAQAVFVFRCNATKVEVGPWKRDGTGEAKPGVVDGLWTGEARSKPVQIEVTK